jgi:hypothetical protein
MSTPERETLIKYQKWVDSSPEEHQNMSTEELVDTYCANKPCTHLDNGMGFCSWCGIDMKIYDWNKLLNK